MESKVFIKEIVELYSQNRQAHEHITHALKECEVYKLLEDIDYFVKDEDKLPRECVSFSNLVENDIQGLAESSKYYFERTLERVNLLKAALEKEIELAKILVDNE